MNGVIGEHPELIDYAKNVIFTQLRISDINYYVCGYNKLNDNIFYCVFSDEEFKVDKKNGMILSTINNKRYDMYQFMYSNGVRTTIVKQIQGFFVQEDNTAPLYTNGSIYQNYYNYKGDLLADTNYYQVKTLEQTRDYSFMLIVIVLFVLFSNFIYKVVLK